MLNNTEKVLLNILLGGAKALAVSAGIVVVSTLLMNGTDGLKNLTLDDLLK